MKRLMTTLMLMLFLAAMPMLALAMSHEGHEKDMKMEHGDMQHNDMKMEHGKMDHESMMMEGDMIMLGNDVQDGVKAMAHLKDVKEAMGKMGMKASHHIMIMFVDEASGNPIESGTAAVKVKGPDGKESDAIELMGMQGHFGADVELGSPGEYHFAVGTKLADGKKRQFEFDINLK